MRSDLRLSPRLRMLADMTPQGARVVDVGTDHAFLPVWLLLNRQIPSAIASDLRPGPLSRAEETVCRHGVQGRVTLRLCDGLTDISAEDVDVVLLAGMGGETIAGILAAAPWTRGKRCLLQPMTAQDDLRRWLNQSSYRIEQERIAREGKTLYIALAVSGGEEPPYTPAECLAGRQRHGDASPLRGEYLELCIRKTTRALEGARRGSGSQAEGLSALLDELKNLREEWDTWQQ